MKGRIQTEERLLCRSPGRLAGRHRGRAPQSQLCGKGGSPSRPAPHEPFGRAKKGDLTWISTLTAAFIPASDFYTIDVADSIGQPATPNAVKIFMTRHPEFVGNLAIPGVSEPFTTTRADVERVIGKYLKAVQDAGAIYHKIAWAKGAG